MPIGRIGSYTLQQTTIANATRTQADIFNKQIQISSGLKARDFAGLSGEVEIFTLLENRLARNNQYSRNNSQILTRLQTTSTALGNIIDLADEFKNLLIQRRNRSLADNLAFDQRIDASFRAIAEQLNTSIEGRYLFSGTRTDTKAVDDDSFPTLVVDGVPDDSYYSGDTNNIQARIQDDFLLTYNVRADDQAIQDLFAGYAQAKTAHAQDDGALLETALNFVLEGIDGVINLQATANDNYKTVLETNERIDSINIYYRTIKDETIGADIVSLSTELAVDQAVLQASFQTFARINSLQLSDFLR